MLRPVFDRHDESFWMAGPEQLGSAQQLLGSSQAGAEAGRGSRSLDDGSIVSK